MYINVIVIVTLTEFIFVFFFKKKLFCRRPSAIVWLHLAPTNAQKMATAV